MLLNNTIYFIFVGQIVTAGLDGKIQLWDTRNKKSPSFVRNMGSDVVSMSLSGFNLIVASGACVYLLDLRNLEKSIQLKDSYMKVPVACVSSVPYREGRLCYLACYKYITDPFCVNDI